MKRVLLAGLTISLMTFAHDEGHGPKLSDSPKHGGKVAPIIAATEAKKGNRAELIYKSELVKSEDGTFKLYVYDKEMNSLPETKLSTFKKQASGSIEHVKKGKIIKLTKFPLELNEGVFVGKAPEMPKTPTSNVDVIMTEGNKDLLAAFDSVESKN